MQNIAAKVEKRRRPTAGLVRDVAGWLQNVGAFQQPAKILFVDMSAGNRLDGALKLGQSEYRRHQLENDRPIFEFRTQSPHRRRQNTPVIVAHRFAQRRERRTLLRAFAPVAQGFGQKAGLIEQFIAFEGVLLVEAALLRSKQRADPLSARQSGRLARPGAMTLSMISGRPLRQSSQGKKSCHRRQPAVEGAGASSLIRVRAR